MTNDEIVARISMVNDIVDRYLAECGDMPIDVHTLILKASNLLYEAEELVASYDPAAS